MLACEAALIAFTVLSDVQGMSLPELLAVCYNGLVATWRSAGGLGAVVGVSTCAVPVTGDGLWVQAHIHIEHLPDAVQDVPAHTHTLASSANTASARMKPSPCQGSMV